MLPTGAEQDSSLLTNGQQNRLSQLTNGVYPCAGKDGNATENDHSKYLFNKHRVDKYNVEHIKSSLSQCEIERTLIETTSSKHIPALNKCAAVEKYCNEDIPTNQNIPLNQCIVESDTSEYIVPSLNQCTEKNPVKNGPSEKFRPSLTEESCLKEQKHVENGLPEQIKNEPTQSPIKTLDVGAPESFSPEPCPPSPSPSPHKDLSSPEECWYNAEMDSGHSTAPSPDTAPSTSPQFPGSLQFYASGILPAVATHRGLVKFVPRHADEVEILVGDPAFVQKECTDFWFEGVNLRTGARGVFPSACVKDISSISQEQLKECEQVSKERYIMDFLGSAEVTMSKGNDMLCKAIEKVSGIRAPPKQERISCILEICELGIKVVNCKGVQVNENAPDVAYYFNLQNVTFCGYHPNNERHFAFVTKHPSQPRFACHVFDGHTSTHHVADVFGVAFQKLLERFVGATSSVSPSNVNP